VGKERNFLFFHSVDKYGRISLRLFLCGIDIVTVQDYPGIFRDPYSYIVSRVEPHIPKNRPKKGVGVPSKKEPFYCFKRKYPWGGRGKI